MKGIGSWLQVNANDTCPKFSLAPYAPSRSSQAEAPFPQPMQDADWDFQLPEHFGRDPRLATGGTDRRSRRRSAMRLLHHRTPFCPVAVAASEMDQFSDWKFGFWAKCTLHITITTVLFFRASFRRPARY
ncbi:hypothetical protein ACRRTK_004781 [Alexandromys fortis]